jgi:hypothetical protein
MKRELIAAACHTINAAYCAAMGDTSQPAWADAPDWQKASALAGVDMHLANPDATPEASHESWLAQKTAEGWKFGKVKDAKKKTHPCFLPYAELPAEQKAKDHLFRAVVHVLKDLPDEAAPLDAEAAAAERAAMRAEVMNELRAEFTSSAKAYVAQAKAATTAPKGSPVAVRYIGHRPTYKEGTYGTGILFTKGKSEFVPADKAAQLLVHKDVYEPGDASECGEVVIDKKVTDDSDDPVQIARDSIAVSGKEALEAYARVHFGVELDRRHTVEALRVHVTGLLDQYGLGD